MLALVHPLQVQEITDLIASFLSKKALFHCIQVSKQWHLRFHAHLWRVITFSGPSLTDSEYDSLVQNASLIQILNLRSFNHKLCARFLVLKNLTNLHKLDIVVDVSNIRAFEDLISLQGRCLRSIKVELYPDPGNQPPGIDPLQIISRCTGPSTRLNHLTISNARFRLNESTHEERRLLANLKSFSLEAASVVTTKLAVSLPGLSTVAARTRENSTWQLGNWNGQGKEEEAHTVNNIRRLWIFSAQATVPEMEDEYGLIVDCQQLRSLTWIQKWRCIDQIYIQMVPDLQAGLWPFLERLDFRQTILSDGCLSEIILAMGRRPLKELRVGSTMFGPLGARALLWRDADDQGVQGSNRSGGIESQQHRVHLERLSVDNCNRVTGTTIQQFLCAFPNLIQFEGDWLTNEDIVLDPRPWVCTELRCLKLTFATQVEEQTPDDTGEAYATLLTGSGDISMSNFKTSSHLFWDRIASLTLLERLEIGSNRRDDLRSLQLRHCIGVGALRTLRRLRQVFWSKFKKYITVKEVEWMIESWPALEVVVSSNRPFPRKSEVESLLKKHGMEWRSKFLEEDY